MSREEDSEDSGVPTSSSFSRKMHHHWLPCLLPQYHKANEAP